jgi:hypothetical protein
MDLWANCYYIELMTPLISVSMQVPGIASVASMDIRFAQRHGLGGDHQQISNITAPPPRYRGRLR